MKLVLEAEPDFEIRLLQQSILLNFKIMCLDIQLFFNAPFYADNCPGDQKNKDFLNWMTELQKDLKIPIRFFQGPGDHNKCELCEKKTTRFFSSSYFFTGDCTMRQAPISRTGT